MEKERFRFFMFFFIFCCLLLVLLANEASRQLVGFNVMSHIYAIIDLDGLRCNKHFPESTYMSKSSIFWDRIIWFTYICVAT